MGNKGSPVTGHNNLAHFQNKLDTGLDPHVDYVTSQKKPLYIL